MPCDRVFLNRLTSQRYRPTDLAETRALADKIASKLGAAVKVGKEAYYQQLEMPIEEAYAYTSEVIVTNLMQPDTVEGMQAFIEKRSPDWK